jgi:transcription elongation factor GreA
MNRYILTPKGYEGLMNIVKKNQTMLDNSTKLKSEAGAGQDDWHDEQFQRAMIEEEMWEKRVKDLEEILSRIEIVEPEEQNEVVDLGTGVILKFENESISKYILDGFSLEALGDRISIYSPLGKAIVGARKGEEVIFRVGENERKVTVVEIYLPSMAEEMIKI